MRKSLFASGRVALICVCLVQLLAAQTARPARGFQIVTANLSIPVAGEKYVVQLRAVGGKQPYHWTVLGTPLPAGLALDESKGIIFGTPQASEGFSVLVQVTDSSEPPLTYSKQLVAASGAPLSIRWTDRPHVTGTNITGAVRVSNDSKDVVDLTVIVVAVNEVGKAFALRYERLNLPPGNETPDLKFDYGSAPIGNYTAHADAVGEVPAKKIIYRDRREFGGLVVDSQ